MPYDLDGMRRRAASASSGGTYWKPPMGSTKIRILPGTVGNCDSNSFVRELRTYNIKFPEGFKKINVPPAGKWDAIAACMEIFKANGMEDQAKSLMPRTTFAMNVNVRGTEDVKIWTISGTNLDKLIGYQLDEDWGDFTDPEEGYCIAVTRTGEQMQTRYDVVPSKITGELPHNWELMAHDLTEAGGDTIDSKVLISMLADKYEEQYENLSSELISARKKFTALLRKNTINKKTAKKRTVKKRRTKEG